MFPAMLVVEYPGYWESEPENWVNIYVNGANVACFTPYRFDENRQPTHYAIRIVGEDEKFIILKQDLNLTSNTPQPDVEIH